MNHRYSATVDWERGDGSFPDRRYSRAHRWTFDGGAVVPASSSPLVVRVPFSDASAVDPEEAFVASLASCHMLWFLDLAAQRGFVADRYHDAATGEMGNNEEGKLAMLDVWLRPQVHFRGTAPSEGELAALHHAAHEACYIASSVRTRVHCEPISTDGSAAA